MVEYHSLKISDTQRYIIILITSLWLLAVYAFYVISGVAANISAYTFYCLKITLLIFPLIIMSRRHVDFLHPLIFLGLLELVTRTIAESSLLSDALRGHEALRAESQETISDVLIFKFAMDCVAIMATYLGFIFTRSPFNLSTPRLVEANAILLSLWISCFIGIFAFTQIAEELGGYDVLLATKGKYIAEAIGGGHWNVITGFTAAAAWFGAAYLRNPERSVVFWASLLLAITIEFAVTASRGATLNILIVVGVLLFARRQKLNFVAVAAVAVTLLLSAGLLSQLRHSVQGIRLPTEVASTATEALIADEALADAMRELSKYSGAGSTDYPIYLLVGTDKPFLLGESYLAILAAPVPRAYWPDKPMGVGRRASHEFMPSYKHDTGVPPTATGEAYWNFGIPGVIIIFFIWGAFLKVLWSFAGKSAPGGRLLYYVVTLIFLRPQTSLFYNWAIAVFPMIGVSLLVYLTSFKADFRNRNLA